MLSYDILLFLQKQGRNHWTSLLLMFSHISLLERPQLVKHQNKRHHRIQSIPVSAICWQSSKEISVMMNSWWGGIRCASPSHWGSIPLSCSSHWAEWQCWPSQKQKKADNYPYGFLRLMISHFLQKPVWCLYLVSGALFVSLPIFLHYYVSPIFLLEAQEQTREIFGSETAFIMVTGKARQHWTQGDRVSHRISVTMNVYSRKQMTVAFLGWACPVQRLDSYTTKCKWPVTRDVDRSTTIYVIFLE